MRRKGKKNKLYEIPERYVSHLIICDTEIQGKKDLEEQRKEVEKYTDEVKQVLSDIKHDIRSFEKLFAIYNQVYQNSCSAKMVNITKDISFRANTLRVKLRQLRQAVDMYRKIKIANELGVDSSIFDPVDVKVLEENGIIADGAPFEEIDYNYLRHARKRHEKKKGGEDMIKRIAVDVEMKNLDPRVPHKQLGEDGTLKPNVRNALKEITQEGKDKRELLREIQELGAEQLEKELAAEQLEREKVETEEAVEQNQEEISVPKRRGRPPKTITN